MRVLLVGRGRSPVRAWPETHGIFFSLFFSVRKDVKDKTKVSLRTTLRKTDWSKNRERCLSGFRQVVECPLSAREVSGSIPGFSTRALLTSKINYSPLSFSYLFLFCYCILFSLFFTESHSVGETLKNGKPFIILLK